MTKQWVRIFGPLAFAAFFFLGCIPLKGWAEPEPAPPSASTPSSAPDDSVSSAATSAASPAPVTGLETVTASIPGASTAPSEYMVQPDDVLLVSVYDEPTLTTRTRVSHVNDINFPLLGRVDITGLTLLKVGQKIAQLLEKDYLVNPQVSIYIESYHASRIFVTGAVNKPGSYTIPAGQQTTLMEAITMAGGFSKSAAINRTRIIRIENGKEKTINVPANDIINGDKNKDVQVSSNDVIFVPESFF